MEGCLECSNENTCTFCEDGYTIREKALRDGTISKECVTCPTKDGCL